MIGRLENGRRGFDCNATISLDVARHARQLGYDFAMRYVRREQFHDYDLTPNEIANLLRADLAIGVVQHVAPPGWTPTARIGRLYGRVAAEEAGSCGYALGSTLWCDLEGVSSSATHAQVIDFCNAWFDQAAIAGYTPGLYVGDSCGLTPRELYVQLRFAAYWRAYNVSRFDEPIVRGCQLIQREASPAELEAFPFEIDVNTIRTDRKGDRPTFMLPAAKLIV